MSAVTTAEALRACESGFIKVGVPIDIAIEAYRQKPSDLTLRTVVLAMVPDRTAAQKEFDCLRLASEDHWRNCQLC